MSFALSGGIPGAIPYLSSSALAGCLLGGIYMAKVGKARLVALIPFVVVVGDSMLSMDRGTMITAAVLFVCGYALGNRGGSRFSLQLPGARIRRIASIAVGMLLLTSSLEFVRSHRGIVESSYSAGSALSRMKGAAFITPSVYFYFTGHFGVLNQYLKKDAEQNIVGRYTLAPIWRTIAKLGFDTKVGPNQPFYATPFFGNNGTYLREFRADYGLAGVVLGPLVLGTIVSGLWFRAVKTGKLVDMMILGHMLVFVVMSIFQVATQQGSWLASLLFGLLLSHLIDRNSSSQQSWSAPKVT